MRAAIGSVYSTLSIHPVSICFFLLTELLLIYYILVTLPLWDPSPVELGAVGYLSRPSGEFVTLFNAFDPPKTSGGRADGMSNLYGYGKIAKGSQRQDRRDMTQRGLDAIRGLLWFRSRNFGDYQ